MQPQLMNSFTDRFSITKIAKLESIKTAADPYSCDLVLQGGVPLLKRNLAFSCLQELYVNG